MSYRQKQGSLRFVRKSGVDSEKSTTGLSKPSNVAQPISDQPIASNDSENAGYRLRSLDKQLASSILEAISGMTEKSLQTLRGVASSKKFKSFTDLTTKNPHMALEILRKRFPNLEIKAQNVPTFGDRPQEIDLNLRAGQHRSDIPPGDLEENPSAESAPSPIPVKRTEDDQSGLSDFDPEGALDQDSILDEEEFQKSNPVNDPTDTNEGGPQASSSAGASSLQDPPEDLTAKTNKNVDGKNPMDPPASLSQSLKLNAPKRSRSH